MFSHVPLVLKMQPSEVDTASSDASSGFYSDGIPPSSAVSEDGGASDVSEPEESDVSDNESGAESEQDDESQVEQSDVESILYHKQNKSSMEDI